MRVVLNRKFNSLGPILFPDMEDRPVFNSFGPVEVKININSLGPLVFPDMEDGPVFNFNHT